MPPQEARAICSPAGVVKTPMKIKDLIVGNLYVYTNSFPIGYREIDLRTKSWDEVTEVETGWEKNSTLMYLATTRIKTRAMKHDSYYHWVWYRFYSLSHAQNIVLPGETVHHCLKPIYPSGTEPGKVKI